VTMLMNKLLLISRGVTYQQFNDQIKQIDQSLIDKCLNSNTCVSDVLVSLMNRLSSSYNLQIDTNLCIQLCKMMLPKKARLSYQNYIDEITLNPPITLNVNITMPIFSSDALFPLFFSSSVNYITKAMNTYKELPLRLAAFS
jgi:hypothetical protein